MKKQILFLTILLSIILSCQTIEYEKEEKIINKMLLESIDDDRSLNPMYREFRAAWFSTVANIDWPVMGGSEAKQKALIIKYLDTLYNNNFNAVFVQVKPDAGVIFKSKINPTTRYFFGINPEDERDDYPFKTDMLEFIINEAHKRNIEVHAWFNPYRISLKYDTNKSYEEQFSKKNFIHTYVSNGLKPVHWYDNRLYLDPGEPISSKYVIDSVVEVVENYDIDGIHFDDYFYQNSLKGKTYRDWPDKVSSSKYASSLGYNPNNTSYDDYGVNGLYAWRRNNINNLVSSIYKEIKSRKPYVKWTISPAGVWRNKEPLSEYKGDPNGSESKSYNPNFDALHADVLLWMINGKKTSTLNNATEKDGLNKMYIDAIIPQIYWSSSHRTVPFNKMVNWWIGQARKATNKNIADIYIGHALYKMGKEDKYEPWKDVWIMSKQVDYIRYVGKGYIKGSSFFTMHNMYLNDVGTGDYGYEAISNIKKNNYVFKAVVPTMNTMKHINTPPLKLENPSLKKSFSVNVISFTDPNEYKLDKYSHVLNGTSVYYVIYRKKANDGKLEIIDKIRREDFNTNCKIVYRDEKANKNIKYIYYVTALDRIHNESEYLVIQ